MEAEKVEDVVEEVDPVAKLTEVLEQKQKLADVDAILAALMGIK